MFGKFIEDNFPSIAEKMNGVDSLVVFQSLMDDFFQAYIIQIALGGLIIILTLAYWLYARHKETDSLKFRIGFYFCILSIVALLMFIPFLLSYQWGY